MSERYHCWSDHLKNFISAHFVPCVRAVKKQDMPVTDHFDQDNSNFLKLFYVGQFRRYSELATGLDDRKIVVRFPAGIKNCVIRIYMRGTGKVCILIQKPERKKQFKKTGLRWEIILKWM